MKNNYPPALLLLTFALVPAITTADLISASGWNVDFILGNDETHADHHKPENANIWFSDDAGISPGGIPASGTLLISGKDFQLEPFTGGGNNVLRGPGTLTLDTPQRYSELTLLGSNTGGSGGDTWEIVLNFTDAPASSALTYTAFGNWAGSGPELNPTLTGNGTTSGFGGQLNTRTLNLFALGHSGKTLSSIDFSGNGNAAGNLALFALSGAAIPEPTTPALLVLGFALIRRRLLARGGGKRREP